MADGVDCKPLTLSNYRLMRAAVLDTRLTNDQTIHKHADGSEDRWKFDVFLGNGGLGVVQRENCIRGLSKGKLRAVKRMPNARQLHRRDVGNVRELHGFIFFSQPQFEAYFVKTLGWYETKAHVNMVMEYLALGDLHELLCNNGALVEYDARFIVSQVLNGLQYMHSNGFAHGSLKLSNILIKSHPPNSAWWIKISDYGLGPLFRSAFSFSSINKCGAGFMAPELFGFCHAADIPSHLEREQKTDMWAVGEILHIMVTRTVSFGNNLEALRDYALLQQGFPLASLRKSGVSRQGQEFIAALMHPQASRRPKPEDALRLPWAALPNVFGRAVIREQATVSLQGRARPFLVFSICGNRLLILYPERLLLVNTANGQILSSYILGPHYRRIGAYTEGTFKTAAFTPDNDYIVVVDSIGSLIQFDAKTLRRLHSAPLLPPRPMEDFQPPEPRPTKDSKRYLIAFSMYGTDIAVARDDHVDIFKVDSKGRYQHRGFHNFNKSVIRSLAFVFFTYNTLAIAHDTEISVFHHMNGPPLLSIHYPAPGPFSAVSPDGKRFVHCTGQSLYLYYPDAGGWRRQYRSANPVRSLSFSSNVDKFATYDDEGLVTLWASSKNMNDTGYVSFSEPHVSHVVLAGLGPFLATVSVSDRAKVVIRRIYGQGTGRLIDYCDNPAPIYPWEK